MNSRTESNEINDSNNKLIEITPNNANSKKKLLKFPTAWIVLMTIRLFLNITGQRSYIHPDEFFQGPEVIAGHVFNCSDWMHHTWEFKFTNQSDPIRNIGIPFFFYGLPFMFLKFLVNVFSIPDFTLMRNGIFNDNSLISLQANTLIYYPRIFMTICSCITDFSILKIAEYCGLDETSVLITFASSYVTLVYLTRTFSNSIETILFSLLLLFVVKSIKSQHILNDKFLIASNNSPKHKQPVIVASTSPDLVASTFNNESKTTHKKDLVDKQSTVMKRIRLFDIYKCDYMGNYIGAIVCLGFFNRPTFLVYALVPCVYWLLYGIENANSCKQGFVFIWRRVCALIKLALPVIVTLILIDTIYYLEIHDLNDFVNLVYIKKRFVLTPLNFLRYNLNSNNLKDHGKHPFYLHSVVNCVLLFGINHLILVFITGKFLIQLFNYVNSITSDSEIDKKEYVKRFKFNLIILYEQVINNRFCFLMSSFLVPLILFSFISHQEPRFLLPLIIPICLLTSHCIFGSNSYLSLRSIWLIFNLIGIAMYGYLHQGGIIASTSYIQKMFAHPSNLELDLHVVYFQTYMPPTYLMLVPFSVQIIQNKRYIYERNRKKQIEIEENSGFNQYNSDKLIEPKRKIYDLMSSSSLNDLNQLLKEIKTNYTVNTRVKKDFAVFLVTPSVYDLRIYKPDNICSLKNKSEIGFQLQTKFRFHISFEHLKSHLNLIRCQFRNNECYLNNCKSKDWLDRVFNSFSLNFYQVVY